MPAPSSLKQHTSTLLKKSNPIKNQPLNYQILFLEFSKPFGFTTVKTLEILKPK